MLIVLDIFVAALLFFVPIICFVAKRRKNNNTKQSLCEIFATDKKDILINSAIGCFFAFTYIAFRYYHTPWIFFGFLHIYGLIATFIMPFALAYIVKGTKQAKTVAIVLSGLLLLSPLTRPLILPSFGTRNTVADWAYAIPLNLCNISAILYLIAILTNSGILKNYMITFGFFGGLVNNIQIFNTQVNYFWYYFTWESYFVHALLIIVPIFMLLTNQIKPDVKQAFLYNGIWVLALFFLAGFLLNPFWGTNYHFTKPMDALRFLPSLKNPLIIFGAEVDPVYMLCFAVLILAACVLLYYLCLVIYKYIRPKINNNSPKAILQ